eukprot:1499706-Pleurochrysis_carterae.AAC.1
MRERHAEALRLRPLGLQRNPCTEAIEPYNGLFDPTTPLSQQKTVSPELSSTPSDSAMVRELERVELERCELERSELAALKAKVAALVSALQRIPASYKAQPPLDASVTPPKSFLSDSPPQRSESLPGRWQSCIALSILLNVAALCAAIAIGAMQLLDN